MPDKDFPSSEASPPGRLIVASPMGLPKSSGFAAAVTQLASGQLVAMMVPIFAAPILGRLYTPAEYGSFALFVAFSSLLAVFSTLQYQHGIIAEKSERRAVELVQLCSVAALLVAFAGPVFAGVVTLVFGWHEVFPELGYWFVFLPFSVLMLGFTASVSALANRQARYRSIAMIQVVAAVATVVVAIGAGSVGWGSYGLLAGYLAGQGASAASYLVLYRQLSGKTPLTSPARLIALSRRHRKFPTYTLPSELLGMFNQQMPTFALSFMGAAALTGSFSRALQLVAAPITLLGFAVGQVFRQKASAQYREYGTCRPLFRRTALFLISFGLPFGVVFSLFAPLIFVVYLGPAWREAGEVAQLLAPMLLLRLVASPLSTVFFFAEAQRNDAAIMFGAFLLCGGMVLSGAILFEDPKAVIVGFSLAYCLIYLVQLTWSYRLAGGRSG